MKTQDCFKIDSFAKLSQLIKGNNSVVVVDYQYFDKRKISNEDRITRAMASAGVLAPKGYDAPHWEGPFMTGKHLDVSAFLNGKDRTMWRKSAQPDGDMLNGRRIVCQLALLANEELSDVIKRALGSIALAAKLQEEGHTVSLMFVWSSKRRAHGSPVEYDRPSFIWVEAKDMSIKTMAQVMDPQFFRSYIFAFRSDSGPNGKLGHGSYGGSSATIQDYQEFRDACKQYGVTQDGDICLDWNLPVERQIEEGMKIVND